MAKEKNNQEINSEKISHPERLVLEYKIEKNKIIKKEQKAVLISVLAIFLVAFLGVTSNSILFPKTVPASKVAKGVAVVKNKIVSGQTVKWTMVVAKSQVKDGKVLAKLPKSAKDIKIATISSKEAKIISTSKPIQQLSLTQRQKLATAYPKNLNIVSVKAVQFIAAVSDIFRLFFADIGDAIDNAFQTVTGGLTTDQNVITTQDATYVDISGTTSPTDATTPVADTTPITPVVADTPTTDNNLPAVCIYDSDCLAGQTCDSGSCVGTATTPPTTDTSTPTNTDYVAIQYTTPAPQTTATVTDTGEQVIVSATNEDPATPLVDVLASTKIPKIFKVGEENKIKIKWKNNGNQNVTFQALDTDNDGYLDYVEWTVPHLSEQIFDIIFISKAFQLDNQQNIIADIYPQTQTKDGNYASLTDGQFIRVTFDQTLTNKNDNTIYARPHSAEGSAEQATIQVYPAYTDQNGNVTDGPLVATFPAIDHEATYKVLLTSLTNPTDLFDLKIVGNVDVDYIVDPSTPCTTSDDCSDPTPYCDQYDSVCTDGSAGQRCTLATNCATGFCDAEYYCNYYGSSSGSTCYGNDDCESYVCGTDHLCNGIGSTCIGRNNCFSGYCDSNNHVCTDGSIGQGCGYYLDCSSGYCDTYNHTCTDGSVGSRCGVSADCVSGEWCSSLNLCTFGLVGSLCSNPGDCDLNIYCSSGKCSTKTFGSSCAINSDCNSDYCDTNTNKCLSANGESCSTGADCGSGNCIGNICEGNTGDHCTSASDCLHGFCNGSNMCALYGAGEICSVKEDCDTNFCDSGYNCSIASQPAGSYCYAGDDCASGTCTSNKCIGNNGDSCGSGSDCAGGYCNSYDHTCTSGNIGDTCNSTASDCSSDYLYYCDSIAHKCTNGSDGTECGSADGCYNNFCDSAHYCSNSGVAIGGTCYADDDCLTNYCNGSTCNAGADGYQPCSSDSDCASGHCNDESYCSTSGQGIGDACWGRDDCVSQLCNTNTNLCVKIPNWEQCDVNLGQDCVSNNCDLEGYCSSLDVLYGGNCFGDDDCRSGFCGNTGGNGICNAYEDGTACNSSGNDSCFNNNCNVEHICSTPNQVSGNPCWGSDDCLSGSCNINGTCDKITDGNTCDSNGSGDCVSGYCDPNINKCEHQGAPCSSNTDCTDQDYSFCNTYAPNGACTNGVTGEAGCAQSSECQTGYCNTYNNICSTGDDGQYCNAKTDCFSSFCNTYDHKCTAGQVGSGCNDDTECGGFVCGTDHICGGVGITCSSGNDCASGNCNTNTNKCTGENLSCNSNANCTDANFAYCGKNNGVGNCTDGSLNKSCNADNQCQSLKCTDNTCNGVLQAGTGCSVNKDCASDICGSGNVCLSDIGGDCSLDADCNSTYCDTHQNAVCTTGSIGSYCGANSDCANNLCNLAGGSNQFKCVNDIGGACTNNSDCLNLQCGTDHKCNGIGSQCVYSGHDYQPDNYNANDFCNSYGFICSPCASGYCDNNDTVCTDGSVGKGCGDNADCQSGYCDKITTNKCQNAIDGACTLSIDCQSGYCDTHGNKCTNGTFGQNCGVNQDCVSGLCKSNKCVKDLGATCSLYSDCNSGACVNNICSTAIVATGITLGDHSLSLTTSDTHQLTGTITPADATNTLVTWASSSPSVASVSNTGLVTAISAGSTTITVTTVDGSFTDTTSVTVTAAAAPIVAGGGGGNALFLYTLSKNPAPIVSQQAIDYITTAINQLKQSILSLFGQQTTPPVAPTTPPPANLQPTTPPPAQVTITPEDQAKAMDIYQKIINALTSLINIFLKK